MIDRFTYATLEYFEQNRVAEDSKNSLKQLVPPSLPPPFRQRKN
jgi:glycosylphosphatidylinositol transamidase (GPIT) subunit GPI8